VSSSVALLASILTEQDACWPDADPPAEQEFLAAAAFHGVAPLLADELDSRSHGCPPSIQCAIHTERTKAATITLIRERELVTVLDRLASSRIQPVLIKGAALAHAHYEQPYLRPSFDIDLFVDRDEMDRIGRVFEAEGYRRSQQVSGDLVMPQMDYEKKDHRGAWHIYDVHWKLASPQAFAHLLTYSDLAADAVAIPALGPHARRPSDVHGLFIACVHRVAHHPGVTRLIWLYDIHLIAERLGTAGLARFAALAMEKGVSGICATALAEAHQWFHTRLPEDLVDQLQAHSTTANEPSRSFIHSQSKVSILLSDLKLVGGWRSRIRLLQQHVFPEPDYMFRLYHAQSRVLLPALYTHRFVTGMGKWLVNFAKGARP